MKLINRISTTLGLFVVILSVNVLANESRGFFVGADAGYGYTKLRGDELQLNLKDNVLNFGLKAGYRLSPEHRIYLAYYHQSKIKDESGFNIEFDDVVIDYISVISKYHAYRGVIGYDFTPNLSENIRGVLGLYGGYSFLHVHTESNFFGETFPLPSAFDGLAYGTKIGLLYEIGSNTEVELGVKLEQIRYKTRDLKLSFDVEGERTDVLTEYVRPTQTTGRVYLGFSFKF